MYTRKPFIIKSELTPKGDQPQAIEKLVKGIEKGLRHQTLLGATGTGKTFTMANVIAQVNKPTLVIAHNKTLAAQLAAELRSFFPNNAVRYFVSYYDYYQPEAYIPKVDKYIEKAAQINQEIEKYRNAATQSLLTRSDVIIVSSVSCIYGLGRPEDYNALALNIKVGEKLSRNTLIRRLIDLQYIREYYDLKPGSFRVSGDLIDIFQSSEEEIIRIELSFDELVDNVKSVDPITGIIQNEYDEVKIFPSKHYVTPFEILKTKIPIIRQELEERVNKLKKEGKILEAERLKQRTNNDIEMLEETGYCTGIENYSRIIEGREPGQPGSCLLDYFPKDFLLFIDESHITIPQIRGMYFGDRSRKKTLIEYGFRLPSALDNRPLNFNEFLERTNQIIYVSATPQEFELLNSIKEAQNKFKIYNSTISDILLKYSNKKTSSKQKKYNKEDKLYNLYSRIITHLKYEDYYTTGIAQQIIRPTGLLDPEIIIKGTKNQIQDLENEIIEQIKQKSRTLIVTLTKKMAEEICEYFKEKGFNIQYLHSDIDTIERVEILKKLRLGLLDIIVGINLLREGLDLPEVSLVAILDADKEGFLRNQTSLIQIIGRAARHINGKVIMYADTITESMELAIEETKRRRKIQEEHNKINNITPQPIIKPIQDQLIKEITQTNKAHKAKSNNTKNLSKEKILKLINEYEAKMKEAANNLDFYKAAEYRDILLDLKEMVQNNETETRNLEKS